MKIGISLSGGAVKGAAHLGVLRALREHDVEPKVFVGTSVGAIVAVMHAVGASDEDILEIARQSKLTKLIKFNWPKKGFLPMSKLAKRLEPYIPYTNIEELPRKTFINVSDLEDGHSVLHNRGPLLPMIMASCAIPMMFEPQQVGNHWYVDGGVINNMPTEELHAECDFVIGVNVVHVSHVSQDKLSGMFPVLDRTLDISLYKRTLMNHDSCDFVFEPPSTHQYNKFAFDKVDRIYQEGYEYAIRRMPDLLDELSRK